MTTSTRTYGDKYTYFFPLEVFLRIIIKIYLCASYIQPKIHCTMPLCSFLRTKVNLFKRIHFSFGDSKASGY